MLVLEVDVHRKYLARGGDFAEALEKLGVVHC